MPAREGSLEAPTRHSLDWTNPRFYDEEDLFKELERVFDICHGCRRCVSLCQSFPNFLTWSMNHPLWKWMASPRPITGRSWIIAISATSVS
jgi:hypothetical protein